MCNNLVPILICYRNKHTGILIILAITGQLLGIRADISKHHSLLKSFLHTLFDVLIRGSRVRNAEDDTT